MTETKEPQICKLKINKHNELIFEGATNSSLTLAEQIEEDKQYGVMVPANGKYFTYSVMDWKGRLITSRQVRKGQTQVFEELERKLNFNVQRTRPDEISDFKLYFRRTADDPLLDENTLQYHYYPIDNVNHPLRGVCVVNTDFPYTIHGKPVDLHFLDPEHYPEISGNLGITYDWDQVYGSHELGHGFGLPHSPKRNTTMYFSHGGMVEHFEDEKPEETIPRLVAKYGARSMLSYHKLRWTRWKRHRFDRY